MVGGFPRRHIPPAPPVESLPPTVPAEDIEYDEDDRLRIKEPLVAAPRPEPKLPPPAPAPKPETKDETRAPLMATNIRPTRLNGGSAPPVTTPLPLPRKRSSSEISAEAQALRERERERLGLRPWELSPADYEFAGLGFPKKLNPDDVPF